MSVLNAFNQTGPERNKGLFKLLAYVIVIAGLFIAGNFLWPDVVGVILNTLWTILLVAVIVFFAIGVMVVIGLRKEATKILDILLEGSLTFIDVLDFIKLVYRKFIDVLKDFILYAAPVFSYVLAFVTYVLVIYLFKSVGQNNDVTILTVVLTFFMVMAFGILTKPRKTEPDFSKWKVRFFTRLRSAFVDGFEVVLFVFFLTMDSTNLLFLPSHLRIAIHAQLFDYDLMIRSFVYNDHLKTTVYLITAAIGIEIVRNIIKIIVAARFNYTLALQSLPLEEKVSKSFLIKNALRRTFIDLKDDLVRFITYNTILFAVFMLFPRLKLLTLVVVSITNLILDILIPSRFTNGRSSDLISRILAKVFRV